MKYYLKDIKWAFTTDGSFAIPYIYNNRKTKIKNLATDEIIDLERNENSRLNDRYAIKEFYEIYDCDTYLNVTSSEDLFFGEIFNINSLIPLKSKIKYFLDPHVCNDKLRNEITEQLKWHAVSEEELKMASLKLQQLAHIENKKAKKRAEKYNKIAIKNKKQFDKNTTKIKEQSKSRQEISDEYKDF